MTIIIYLVLLIVFTSIFAVTALCIINYEEAKNADRTLDELIREYSHKEEDTDEKNF